MLEKRLKELGFHLPAPQRAPQNINSFTICGSELIIPAQLPYKEGKILHMGQIGYSLTAEKGIEAAQHCILNILAQVQTAIENDWSRIKRCLTISAYIACEESFHDHEKIMDAASQLLISALNEKGAHARSIVGVSSLPMGAPVQIQALFELV